MKTEDQLRILVQLLKEDDTLELKAFDDVPKSMFRVTEVINDVITGYALFDGDEYEEYGELYWQTDFHLINAITFKF
jgi:hypothetical protein